MLLSLHTLAQSRAYFDVIDVLFFQSTVLFFLFFFYVLVLKLCQGKPEVFAHFLRL